MSELVVHHLNCASISGLAVLGQHLVCHVALIETPKSGLVLIDTGLGTADYADITRRLGVEFAKGYARPKLDPSLAAINQIVDLGYDPADVRHIIQTHLDLDHVGGLSDFPDAKVHVHQDELAAATDRRGVKARARDRPKMWAHGPDWAPYATGGEPWFGFETVRGLVGLPEDILLVPLGGHTLGHVGVAVQTKSGWLLAAGDAYFDHREVKGPTRRCSAGANLFQLVVTTDYRQRHHNQDRLRALASEHNNIAIYAAHDPFEYFALARAVGDPIRGMYAEGPRRHDGLIHLTSP